MSSALGPDPDLGLAWPTTLAGTARARPRRDVPRRSHTATNLWPPSVLAVAMGLGLLMIASADVISLDGSKWAEPLFWAGMLVLWVPPIVRIVGPEASRSERIALLVLLGMAMYVVKLLYSPRYFIAYDEFLHWRTAEDIAGTGKLFSSNPLLPVSPLYPGLEIATSAIAHLTGLSAFVAGALVVGAARLILIVALYLLYEGVSGSSWVAGVATAVYFTNPQFLFFDSAYAYESLALSLALLVLYTVWRGGEGRGRNRPGATLLVILPLAGTVVTHHIASFALAIALGVLVVVSFWFPSVRSRLWYLGMALVAAGFVLLWLVLVAGQVIGYLEPNIVGGVGQVIDLIRGEGASRHLFQSYVGQRAPPLDRVASFAFTAITLVALPLGWLQIWRTRRLGTFTVFLVVCSFAYPASGLFRFTTIGVDLSERLSAFVFVPVSYCMAMAIARRGKLQSSQAWALPLAAIGALLLYGGIAVGNPSWARLPGPYLVSADSRSVEPEGISAASWTGEFLGHGNRIGADRINGLLMLTYGDQRPITSLADEVDLAPVFLGRQLTPYDTSLLRRGGVHYLVADYRLTRSLPWLGFYYDAGEPGGLRHKRPIPTAAFAKFDRTWRISRVFDSGDIVIFDVSGVARRG